jgi:hypothetical protein
MSPRYFYFVTRLRLPDKLCEITLGFWVRQEKGNQGAARPDMQGFEIKPMAE